MNLPIKCCPQSAFLSGVHGQPNEKLKTGLALSGRKRCLKIARADSVDASSYAEVQDPEVAVRKLGTRSRSGVVEGSGKIPRGCEECEECAT